MKDFIIYILIFMCLSYATPLLSQETTAPRAQWMSSKLMSKWLKEQRTLFNKKLALEKKINKEKNPTKLIKLYKDVLYYDSLYNDGLSSKPDTLQLSSEVISAMYNLGLYYGFGKFDLYDIKVNEDGKLEKPLNTTNKEVSVKYLQTVFERENDMLWRKGWAGYALALLSLDRIENNIVAHDIFEKLKWMCFSIEEDSQWNTKWGKNVGTLISLLEMSDLDDSQDLQAAYYHSWWTNPVINNPQQKNENQLSIRIMEIAKKLKYDEKTKEIGVGLSSSVLLKHAVDLYSSLDNSTEKYVRFYLDKPGFINESAKNNINKLYKRRRNINSDIAFWIERSLSIDPYNANAYYFTGTLYLNGEGGLPKSRQKAKIWFADAAKLGSNEGKAALAAIEEIEYAERKNQRAKRIEAERRETERRMRRKQAWTQAIGAIVQAAGTMYMASQGYVNNVNLLNPNLAMAQVENQYAQMAMLQQVALQNIKMPQFDSNFNCSVPNSFMVDWNKVKWESAPIDTYYLYQGDLINNGVNMSVGNQVSPAGSAVTPANGRTCNLCHGTQKCWTCYGKRTYINPLTGKSVVCPNCSDGWCSKCHGTGKL